MIPLERSPKKTTLVLRLEFHQSTSLAINCCKSDGISKARLPDSVAGGLLFQYTANTLPTMAIQTTLTAEGTRTLKASLRSKTKHHVTSNTKVATLSNEHQSAKRPIGSRRHWISFKLKGMESGLWEVAYWDLKGKYSGLRRLDANFLSHPFCESRYTLNLEPRLVNLQIYTFPLMPHAFNSQLHWLSLATVSPTKNGLTWCPWTPPFPLHQGTWQFQWPRCGRCVHWSQRPW